MTAVPSGNVFVTSNANSEVEPAFTRISLVIGLTRKPWAKVELQIAKARKLIRLRQKMFWTAGAADGHLASSGGSNMDWTGRTSNGIVIRESRQSPETNLIAFSIRSRPSDRIMVSRVTIGESPAEVEFARTYELFVRVTVAVYATGAAVVGVSHEVVSENVIVKRSLVVGFEP